MTFDAREIFNWNSENRGQNFEIAPAFTTHTEMRVKCTCRAFNSQIRISYVTGCYRLRQSNVPRSGYSS